MIASPHPLDFDWRFDEPTLRKLCSLLGNQKVLVLGAPSIAGRLEALGSKVLLIDRQPIQNTRNQLVADIPALDLPAYDFETAIADPPWYPEDLVNWAATGARALGVGAMMFVSVWPPETRPGADSDLEWALAKIEHWANIVDLGIPLGYRVPRFEEVAMEVSHGGLMASSPKHGQLLKLEIRDTPPRPTAPAVPTWQRFFLDGYQLAVKLSPGISGQQLIKPHPHAKGWLWPFVSARAPGRNQIGVWSSEGEVGLITDPDRVISALKNAFATDSASAFETSLQALPEMTEWKIPRPPYQKTLEWIHR